jgi:hypothetical protein
MGYMLYVVHTPWGSVMPFTSIRVSSRHAPRGAD